MSVAGLSQNNIYLAIIKYRDCRDKTISNRHKKTNIFKGLGMIWKETLKACVIPVSLVTPKPIFIIYA